MRWGSEVGVSEVGGVVRWDSEVGVVRWDSEVG